MGDPHVVPELGHVLFGGCLFGDRPRQHELGLEHRLDSHNVIEGCRHPRNGRMLDPALDVPNPPASIALVRGAVELLGGSATPGAPYDARFWTSGSYTIRLPPEPPRSCRRHVLPANFECCALATAAPFVELDPPPAELVALSSTWLPGCVGGDRRCRLEPSWGATHHGLRRRMHVARG